MFKVLVLLAIVGAAVAHFTAPVVPAVAYTAHSTVVKSDRVGGNFAYSVHQNPAVVSQYASTVPVVRTVSPVVTYPYTAGTPLTYGYQYGHGGAAVVPTVYKTGVVAQPGNVYYTNTHNVAYPYQHSVLV